MIIRDVNLETVCGVTSKMPENILPEFAFAGKSNVGKSSLINALMNRKAYARTSSQPGKTQTINFYNINGALYYVDLPGYGYAKIAVEVKEKWGKMIERYLRNSQMLKMVFLLIDIRHEPSANDKMMYDWITYNGYHPVIIATKMDNWYVGGTEVVFACGGGIYLSCLSAAESNDGKMIGVDVDQSNVSDRIITSAMKALSNSVVKALTDASANDWTWPESYAGVCQYLGAADDCVGLPMETSQFTKFTQEQYDTLFQAMADGSLVVDNNSSADVKPVTTNVTVDYQ